MLPLIEPDWPAPENVRAFTTTRRGGVSASPYDTLNLGTHVGDDAQAVAANESRVLACLPGACEPHWMQQVHGAAVVPAGASAAPQADAQYSREAGRLCTVLTADCLPVLFCSRAGDVVAAAHAGWRGLAAGVLENTVAAMGCAPEGIIAWLGPAIGPESFEVGAEVREAFLHGAGGAESDQISACFNPQDARPGHFLADLYELARLRLRRLGLTGVYGGGFCTYRDSARFFSYRRDSRCGRMASVIVFK